VGAISEIPEIDIGPLRTDVHGPGARATGEQIDAACRNAGFFYVTSHGVDPALVARLDALARAFFGRPEGEKTEVALEHGGRAWRGWFPVGGELTAGVADQKEGIYFGAPLGADDRRVIAGLPLHGANLHPRRPAELGPVVESYMESMTEVAQSILSGMALGLGLDPGWFRRRLTADPLVLFRIFRYPALEADEAGRWSVGEHTDYGLLTVLGQDDQGGLQVGTDEGWLDVDPRPGRFVCNLGDMLERLTGGRYRSTRHRVRHGGVGDRLSFPFFLDPSWDATVDRLPIVARPVGDDAGRRWDQISVHGFEGTYGQYIVGKVGKVFPELAAQTLVDEARADEPERPESGS
jgi:isopenicillin N synthase-like dioxygenase